MGRAILSRVGNTSSSVPFSDRYQLYWPCSECSIIIDRIWTMLSLVMVAGDYAGDHLYDSLILV